MCIQVSCPLCRYMYIFGILSYDTRKKCCWLSAIDKIEPDLEGEMKPC